MFSSKSLTESCGNQFIRDLWFAFYFQYTYKIDLNIQLKANPLQTCHSNSLQSKNTSGIKWGLYEADAVLKEQ